MKLRVARKMDLGRIGQKPDKRPWWDVYNVDQLRAAVKRLRRSWATHREAIKDDDGKRWWTLVPDWFMSNRVESRRVRTPLVRKRKKARARDR